MYEEFSDIQRSVADIVKRMAPPVYNSIEEHVAAVIERHESVRARLTERGNAAIYFEEERTLVKLDAVGNIIERADEAECPEDPKAFVIEDGFCHTVDAAEQCKSLPDPGDYYDYNFEPAKRAERCGCCHCGAIFSGSEVTDGDKQSKRDPGMAFCPKCGMNAVLIEDEDTVVNDNTLWYWFRNTFGESLR